MHTHVFEGAATANETHLHYYSGTSSTAPNTAMHTHYMKGYTTFNDGHRHRFSLKTGPEVEVKGGHIHYYSAATDMENNHVHRFRGYTSIS